MKERTILLFLFLSLNISTIAQEELTYFSAPGWIPFLSLEKDPSGNYSGLAVDLMNIIAAELGITAKLEDLPWKRGGAR